MEVIMAAPLTVNTNAEVEINDSCNCCFPFRRKKQRHHHIEKKVDKVYQENVANEKPKMVITKTVKKNHSEPTLLMTTGEWIFEDIPRKGFQGYD